jgi:hypothetical protein
VTPLGEREIADLLGVKRETVVRWKMRGLLPEPAGTVSGNPWWSDDTILAWAKETGRLEPCRHTVTARRRHRGQQTTGTRGGTVR